MGERTMNNTHRFDGKSEIYAKARPKYAPELFVYLQNTLHVSAGSIFADIGSGTGIFTEQLLNCGYRVYAVEPGEDMRRKAVWQREFYLHGRHRLRYPSPG